MPINDKPENLLRSNWQNEECHHRHKMQIGNNRSNTATWAINIQAKLFIEINKDPDRVLTMIVDMRNIYTKYMNQSNHVNN